MGIWDRPPTTKLPRDSGGVAGDSLCRWWDSNPQGGRVALGFSLILGGFRYVSDAFDAVRLWQAATRIDRSGGHSSNESLEQVTVAYGPDAVFEATTSPSTVMLHEISPSSSKSFVALT
jgi:hypothetical protein